jgi:threonine/homoserine/homoserine lactone efflux protein
LDPRILAFLLLSAALTVTPGADMALVTRNTLSLGRGPAFFTTLGISAGIAAHALLWAAGLSAIVSRSAELFEGVKLVGAAYLVFLGVRSLLWPAAHGPSVAAPGREAAEARVGRGVRFRSFSQGFLTNILNPKVALFYLTFLPQFIVPTDPVVERALMLAGIHIGLGIIWLTFYAYLIDRLSSVFMRESTRRRIERITGGMLVALGLGLAWERR